jgi:acetoin utilization protein AcuB
MLVQDVMQTRIVTIKPDTMLPQALRLIGQRGVRHLPVVRGDELVGIVADRDVKRTLASAGSLKPLDLAQLVDRLRVSEIMTPTVITIGPRFPVEEAARVMIKEQIGALPVIEAGRLVGLVTERDVLRVFVAALGAGAPSSRLDVALGDGPSALTKLVEAIAGTGTAISSIVTVTGRDGTKEAVVRVATTDPGAAIEALEAQGFATRDTWRG